MSRNKIYNGKKQLAENKNNNNNNNNNNKKQKNNNKAFHWERWKALINIGSIVLPND